jgi:integrase/recombinase XerD
MSEKPISQLRRRMIEDMAARNFVEKTRNDYIRQVTTFTAFLGRSPDTAIPEDLRRFQLHQTQTKTSVRPLSINRLGCGASLLFHRNTRPPRDGPAPHLRAGAAQKMPAVLSLEEVARLLEAARGPKYKAALGAAYGAGLRVSEVVSLKVSDIDSERMLLRIEQGKGRKDRFAMLSPKLLELLRDWHRIARPAVWLFPGRDPMLPMTTRQFARAVHAAASMAVIKKRVTPHTLLAYAFGRTTSRISVVDGRKRVRRGVHRPMDQWDVLIKDHHAAYITWHEFERNLKAIANNATGMSSALTRGAAREGELLLPGLLRCGHCGRKLHVHYGGKLGRYNCLHEPRHRAMHLGEWLRLASK